MKYFFTLLLIFVGLNSLLGQSRDEVLRQELYEVTVKYIQSSDLSQQNSSNPDCEPFNPSVADEFVMLFEEKLEYITIPYLYSMKLIGLYDTTLEMSSERIVVSELYMTVDEYYRQSQGSDSLRAFTYSPTNPVIRLYKHEKKIKGNQYQSVFGFSYQVKVCIGQRSFHYRLPVIITCTYKMDESGINYTYPKISKVEIGEAPGGGAGFDLYFTPFLEASYGTMNFDNNKVENFTNESNGNYGAGIYVSIKGSNDVKVFSKSLLLGVSYRQIGYTHSLDNQNVMVANEAPPFSTINENIIAEYNKEITYNSIVENSKLSMITIPVGIGLDYRFGGINGTRSLYVNPTISFGIPIRYKSVYSSGNVDYIGHFKIAGPAQSFPITIDDFYGFGTGFEVKPATNDYPLNKFNLSGELEFGYKLKMNPSSSFKIGCFASYGFTNIFENNPTGIDQLTTWDGEMYSYPYFSNPVTNILLGVRLSIQNFGFQWKKTIDSIEKVQ